MGESRTDRRFLGIDIGSVSFGYVLIDQDGMILQSDYLFHHGNIQGLLEEPWKGWICPWCDRSRTITNRATFSLPG